MSQPSFLSESPDSPSKQYQIKKPKELQIDKIRNVKAENKKVDSSPLKMTSSQICLEPSSPDSVAKKKSKLNIGRSKS